VNRSATIDLRDHDGSVQGAVEIACLPGAEEWRGRPTLEVQDSQEPVGGVRLLEETHYRYTVSFKRQEPVTELEPRELFSPDTANKVEGRLSTGRVTGSVQVVIGTEAGERYTCDFEIASRKLNYETEYRRMMLRLAEEGAELVQSAFAPGAFTGFQPDQDVDARTLYQRFAFLESFLSSEIFAEAIETIRYRPHSQYGSEEETVDPASSLKPSPSLVRQLTAGVARQPLTRPIAGLDSIPRTLIRHAHVETLDTVPNRFVRFALEHWKNLAGMVAKLLPASTVEGERGRREAHRLETQIGHLLTMPAMTEAGPLERFPGSNTVLHGRAGYREILRAFLLGEVATSLSWDGGEDVFSAGKRDVATLYEYWVFLELARTIEAIPCFEFDKSELVTETPGGLELNLRRGNEVAVIGQGERRGRTVRLELWFNRTFGRRREGDSSWSVAMRPDCSLRIIPEGAPWEADTWVHFDAKYRIHHYKTFFTPELDVDPGDDFIISEPGRQTSEAKRDDLRKMHAYRDAIRRTAGAYVLYPGDNDRASEDLRQYHEVLPGLGAFVLRPSENGEATTVAAGHLRNFLIEVIDHTAAQGTVRERVRYWEREAYANGGNVERRFDYQPGLDQPPADSTVVLGYLRSEEHRHWVEERMLYNVRADPDREGSVDVGSPLLQADYVALYSGDSEDILVFRTTGALFVWTGDNLRETGYPVGPGTLGSGSLYLCIELGERLVHRLDGELVRSLASTNRAPTAVTWDDLVEPTP
jgi:predicted component of viral defense system (DUF524 family)